MSVCLDDNGIAAVDTCYVRPQMDASHLIVQSGRAAFVDTGTNDSVPHLLAALGELGLSPDAVDFVFLTHIHLDHAGGAGLLMSELPNAHCVVHPRGAPHMQNPAKLEAGTAAVYGEQLARQMYGTLMPIAADRLLEPEDGETFSLAGRKLTAFYTEGHALHHYCLSDASTQSVFTGDSFGISYRELDAVHQPFIFPTTTPTHFDPEAAHASIDRILGYAPTTAYLTHYSAVTDLPRLAADLHRHLERYVEIAEDAGDVEGRVDRIQWGLSRYLIEEIEVHGAPLSEEEVLAIIDMDLKLNAQGLDVWLRRLARQD